LPNFEKSQPAKAGERNVKVEVLYVAQCPSHDAAVKLVKDALATQGIAAEIQEVLVSDERMADEFKFLGSPSIRINGQDVWEKGKSHRALH
jgi:hypothetical protein